MRLVLVHWKPAEVRDRIEDLAHDVTTYSEPMGRNLGQFRDPPPDAVLISLERLPSHGREVALWFRQTKATRHVPLVFVGGKPDKVERARAAFPDAVFTEWDDVESALQRATRRRQRAVPPNPSGTRELWKKLGIREADTVAVLGGPKRLPFGKLPSDVTLKSTARGKADLVILFPKSTADLVARWPAATRMLPDGGRIWLAWPKLAAGVETDVTQDVIRGFGISQGWVDVKICKIDDTWSGLWFARKAKAKAKRAR